MSFKNAKNKILKVLSYNEKAEVIIKQRNEEIERLKSELLLRDMDWLPEKDAEIEKLRKSMSYVSKELQRENHLWVEDEIVGLGEILADALTELQNETAKTEYNQIQMLKLCPFCAGEAVVSFGKNPDGSPWKYIECIYCSSIAEPEMWNKRPLEIGIAEILKKKIENAENNFAKETENFRKTLAYKEKVINTWYEFYKSCAEMCNVYGEVEPSVELDNKIISQLKKGKNY